MKNARTIETIDSVLASLQARLIMTNGLHESETKRILVSAIKRSIKKRLWELPPEDRLLLADGGPETPV